LPNPTVAGRLIRFTVSLVQWIVWIVAVLIVIAIGPSLEILHQLDAAVAPYTPALQVVLPALVGLGFVMFMGGIIQMILQSGTGNEALGEVSLRELKMALRDGRWRRDARMRKFFVIAAGVFLMITAGVAMGIVFTEPGMKLFFLLPFLYAVFRMSIGFYRA
jgi:hypothetical protein